MIYAVILLIIGVILIGFAFLSSNVSVSSKKRRVAIEVISHIWQKKKESTIALEELATLWKSRQNIPTEAEVKEDISFQHEEIKDFYSNYLKDKTFFNGSIKSVIEDILLLLDREGDCPSVVNFSGEPEGSLEKNAYDMLAGIKLYQHSISVAEEMIRLMDSNTVAPKAIITALGHDLGKIQSFRQKYYSMGDHPLVSITVMEGIKGIKNISYKDEILKAIKDHHRSPKGLLGEKLKEADQNVRRKELVSQTKEKENILQNGKINEVKTISREPIISNEAPKPPVFRERDIQKQADMQTKADIFGQGDDKASKKEKITVKEIPLTWFDADEFLLELKPYINKLNGGRWDAFSMKNGYVYFQVKTIWEVIKKIAKRKGYNQILAGDMDEDFRRDCIYSVIQNLKNEKDAIARGLIQDGYFGAPFVVKMSDGTEFNKGFYTPFNVEAFETSVSELELKKKGRIKEIVEVSPKFSELINDS
jgi:hypothetical protein